MDNPLCLNDWWASAGTPRKGVSHIAAQYLIEPEDCPKCGVVGRLYRHGYKMIDYCDAPSYGQQTQIVALLAKPLGAMQGCPSCNGEFPASSFRADVCGSCHYRFHTGEGSITNVDNIAASTL